MQKPQVHYLQNLYMLQAFKSLLLCIIKYGST